MRPPQPQLSEEEFNTLIHQLNQLIEAAEMLPFPRAREQIFEMLQCVDLIHREGLNRLAAFLHEAGHGELLARAAEDPVVHTLLLLYDMVEVEPALEGVAAGQHSFIALNDVQLASSDGPGLRSPSFVPLAPVDAVPPGSMTAAASGTIRVLLVNVDGEIFAIGDLCPGSQLSLSSGELEGSSLRCPWHGELFDVRSGRCLDPAGRTDEPRLPVYPVRVAGEQIEIGTMTGKG